MASAREDSGLCDVDAGRRDFMLDLRRDCRWGLVRQSSARAGRRIDGGGFCASVIAGRELADRQERYKP
jgi:hypothetical protein